MHTATHLLARLILLGALISTLSAAAPPATTLGIAGTRFTINGQPTFLLGFSYYAGLGAPREFVLKDLDDLQKFGFNWLHVWATWDGFKDNISAVDTEGHRRSPYFEKLLWLVEECDGRGLIVDVTLSRQSTDKPAPDRGQVANAAAHLIAVETIVRGLKAHRNWYLDLANERDVRDARFVSAEELSRLRERVRALDPKLLVTASFGGHDLDEEDLRAAIQTIRLDFVAPHRPRGASSPGETFEHTQKCLNLMKKMGRAIPIHYQEPFRRGYTQWQPTAEDFLTDLHGAQKGGAAGWCFHNGSQRGSKDEQPRRSFDLREKRLLDQLDDEERKFIGRAAK